MNPFHHVPVLEQQLAAAAACCWTLSFPPLYSSPTCILTSNASSVPPSARGPISDLAPHCYRGACCGLLLILPRFAFLPLAIALPCLALPCLDLNDLAQSAVNLMKNVVERGPWMENMRAALRRATAGDYGGALVLYSRLAEVRRPARNRRRGRGSRSCFGCLSLGVP